MREICGLEAVLPFIAPVDEDIHFPINLFGFSFGLLQCGIFLAINFERGEKNLRTSIWDLLRRSGHLGYPHHQITSVIVSRAIESQERVIRRLRETNGPAVVEPAA